MKLMMNGAITLGTEDGANVEIHSAVGDDNIIIFGMQTPEVLALQKNGYSPLQYYNNNSELKAALDFIGKGIAGQPFENIYNTLKESRHLYGARRFCRLQKGAAEGKQALCRHGALGENVAYQHCAVGHFLGGPLNRRIRKEYLAHFAGRVIWNIILLIHAAAYTEINLGALAEGETLRLKLLLHRDAHVHTRLF